MLSIREFVNLKHGKPALWNCKNPAMDFAENRGSDELMYFPFPCKMDVERRMNEYRYSNALTFERSRRPACAGHRGGHFWAIQTTNMSALTGLAPAAKKTGGQHTRVQLAHLIEGLDRGDASHLATRWRAVVPRNAKCFQGQLYPWQRR